MLRSPMSDGERERLANILAWLRLAKENLPALNNRHVGADRMAVASGLIDRMQAQAEQLAARFTGAKPSAARAA